MIQDQLVDYVSSQLKLGVSRDAIKTALVSAGWIATDVEDTLKKIDGGTAQPSTAKPAAGSTMTMSGNGAAGAKPAGAQPQMIRVSDLVSASPASVSSPVMSSPLLQSTKSNPSQIGGKISGNSFEASPAAGASGAMSMSGGGTGSKKMLIGGIVAVVLILALGGLAFYFYSGNAGLAAQVAMLNGDTASVNGQLTTLKSQLDASSTDFATQVANLTAANTDLQLNLSFYAAPIDGASSTAQTEVPVTISGSLSGGGKASYAVTTPRGAKIFIANSADAKIGPELKSMIGDTVQLAGAYIPGSDQMTVSSATDLSPAPAPVATTTAANASTTTSAATSTAQ